MKRLMTLVSVLAVLVAIPGMATAAPPERSLFEGDRATAVWETESSDSFVFTEVFLSSGTTTGVDPEEGTFIDFARFEFNDEGFVQLLGEAELGSDDYAIDASGGTFSAWVLADLVVWGRDCLFGDSLFADCELIGPFVVTVDVVWDDASGRIFPLTEMFRELAPGEFAAGRATSLARESTASGTVAGDLAIDLGEGTAWVSRNVEMEWVQVNPL